jgi:hypothetical protein
MDAAMPRKTPPPPEQTLALLNTWLKAARDAINHIGCTRGPRAAYYYADRSPWPTDATEILRARTPEVIAYLQARHALEVRVPLERIVQAADTWMTKRDRIVQFPQTLPKDPDAVRAAVDELARFSEEGLAERRRLDLDLCIAEGALWRGSFPLLAECYGKQRRFVIRRNLIAWSIWVRDTFAEAIRDWPLPNEAKLPAHGSGRRGASSGWLESVERWELVAVVFPRYVPRTDEDPKKLAIEEARRAGDLPVVLPLIGGLFDELREFVDEAVRWPQGNLQPSRTEHLLRAVNALEELVGTEKATAAARADQGAVAPPSLVVADAHDKHGYVESPSDPKSYLPLNVLLADHTRPELGMNVKQASRLVDDYSANRIRWTRPRGKHGKPIPNRRHVHIGDWIECMRRKATTDPDGFPPFTEGEVERRTAEMRKRKEPGAASSSLPRHSRE